MKLLQLLNKNRRYLIAAGAVLAGLLYLHCISVKVTRLTLTGPDGKQQTVAHPFRAKSTGVKTYTYNADITAKIARTVRFNITAIDTIESLAINGVPYDLNDIKTKYRRKELNEWYYGILLDIPLQSGRNVLQIISRDKGHFFGMHIKPKLTAFNFTIIFLLCGIPVLLLFIKLALILLPRLQSWIHAPKRWNIALIILILGILIRLLYTLSRPPYFFEHDLSDHIHYLEFTSQNFEAPQVTLGREFPQQPLYYLLGGAFLRLETALGMTWQQALRGMQFVSVLLSAAMLFFSYRFLQALTRKRAVIATALGFLAFTPSLVYMAARISNDVLMTMWGALICWRFALFWKDYSFKNFTAVTGLMLLAFFTKITAGLFPLVLLLLLVRKFWISQKSGMKLNHPAQKKTVLMATALILIFSFAGGLAVLRSYQPTHGSLHFVRSGQYQGQIIRNMDVTYFASFRLDKLLSQGSSHIFDRDKTIQESFFTFQYGTMMFGEFDYNHVQKSKKRPRSFKLFMSIIYLLGTVYVAGIAAFILFKRHQSVILRTLAVSVLINLLLIIFFAFRYPSYCNTDFRYYAAVFPILAAMAAFGIDFLGKRFPRSKKLLTRTTVGLQSLQFVWLCWLCLLLGRL